MKKTKQEACCATGCCPKHAAAETPRTVRVDFLYLDLSTCGRCKGTDATLDEAAADVRKVLGAAGVEIDLHKTHVTSEAQAKKLGFATSPTVRVMGRDVQMDFKESSCEACGGLAECGVDCRVWTWRGKEYTSPPKEMLVDAILCGVYAPESAGPEAKPLRELPENLRRFFRKGR